MLYKISRVLFGLIFFVFGAAGLFQLLPQPENLPEKLVAFMTGISAASYFMPLLKATEMICGFFILINISTPVMLVILAPICLNIFLVHLFLTPGVENIILPMIILILFTINTRYHWQVFKPLFKAK